jgi:citrate lyase subunit beta/citryl-CoA lyase
MPGVNSKALEKAKSLAADVLIFDLEDSVAPEAKDEARSRVAEAVGGGGYGRREVIARINALATPWGRDDIAALGSVRPNGLLAPKVETGGHVSELDDAMTEAGFNEDVALWVMIETPRAILNIADIAGAARATRLACFVMGTNDLAKEMRARPGPDRTPFHPALALAVSAARTEDLTAIDGVYNDIANAAGFEAECRQGLEFGFDGKTLIHPSQLDICNAVFAPTEEELARARAIIAAFTLPENAGKGVIRIDGRMTELLHFEEARRVVAVAEAISRTA